MTPMDGIVLGDAVALTEGYVRIFMTAQFASLLLIVSLLLASHHAYLFGDVRRVRSFRCPLVRREVEVEFLERWVLAVRRSATACRCSAFERPTAVECGRRCVDRAFRTQWEAPLSTGARRSSSVAA